MSKKYDDFIEALEKLCEEHDVQFDFYWCDIRTFCTAIRLKNSTPISISEFFEDRITQEQS